MTFIDVGDNRLYLQVEGAGDPVVLLHGRLTVGCGEPRSRCWPRPDG
jgi:hypothetical protein